MNRRGLFIKKIILIAAVCVLADMAIGGLLHHFYASISHGEQGRINYAVDSNRSAILVLGSSRASHHYISNTITERSQLSCYNAGKDKQGLFYSLAMLKMVVARHPPAYVILDFNPYAFAAYENGLDLLSVLLPYYRQHPEIRPVINKRSRWEPVKTWSSLYCYNSLLLQIIFNHLSGGRDAGAVNGYVPLYRVWNNSANTARLLRDLASPADSLLVNAFEEIVAVSAAHGCKLIVVASPFFVLIPQKPATIEKCEEICRARQIPFLDYSSLPPFVHNTQLFADGLHLNHAGASLFTDKLCSDLLSRKLIKSQSAELTPR